MEASFSTSKIIAFNAMVRRKRKEIGVFISYPLSFPENK
tara:strand:- start:1 stop:117 length:117 start_codon:yes stop_codon:yes gene_type:complete